MTFEAQYVFGPASTGTLFESDGNVGFVPGQGLASSVKGMDHMVRTMVAAGAASLSDAVRMASLTPARIAGWDRELGSIAVGKLADLLVLDRKLQVQSVFLGGRRLWPDEVTS